MHIQNVTLLIKVYDHVLMTAGTEKNKIDVCFDHSCIVIHDMWENDGNCMVTSVLSSEYYCTRVISKEMDRTQYLQNRTPDVRESVIVL